MLSRNSRKVVSALRLSHGRLLPTGARQFVQTVSRGRAVEQGFGFPPSARPQLVRLHQRSLRWMSTDAQSQEAKEKQEADGQDASNAAEATPKNIKGNETIVGEEKSYGFQAETRQLLDIVTHSLYADREVFIRELVSNASDALEKARHVLLTSQGGAQAGQLTINISVDTTERMFVIADNGVGMTQEEMMENLGTIARSGSKAFLNQLASQGVEGSDLKNSIIGKFGVGFYSAFMVSDKVQVFSRKRGEEVGHCWTSQGDGSYTIAPANGVEEGTKIVLHLRSDAVDFAKEETVKAIVNKYVERGGDERR